MPALWLTPRSEPPLAGQPKLVDRVLDVQPGQLCFVLGTVYMDMPLKPNVLEDITKDVRRRPQSCPVEILTTPGR